MTPQRASNLSPAADGRFGGWRTLVVALQHAGLALVFLVYPLAVARQLELSAGDTGTFLAGSLLAAGISTAMHWMRPPWGSGSLAVEIPTPVYIPVLAMAGSVGGLPMIAGVCILCGVTELVFSRVFKHIRTLFPPEVCGIALILLGVSISKPALQSFFSSTTVAGAPGNWASLAVAGGTFASMVAATLYGGRSFKLYTLAIGSVVGIGLSVLLGVWGPAENGHIAQAAALGLPTLAPTMPRFDLSLLPLALVMGVAVAVDNVGMLVSIQRQRDSAWRRIDPAHTAGGINVSGVGDILSGVLGGMPTGISSANIGLAYATGVTSRIVPVLVGASLVLAALSPKLIAVMSMVPTSVVGAIVVFAACFMMVSGMELLFTRMINERRIITIGASLVVGLAPEAFDTLLLNDQVPAALAPILKSQLALALLTAITLNAIFRIGVADRAALTIAPAPADDFLALREFMNSLGLRWGVRRDVIDQAVHAGTDLLEALSLNDSRSEPVALTVRRGDVFLDLTFTYHGPALEFASTAPPLESLEEGRVALARFSAYVAAQTSDQVVSRQSGDARSVTLRFEN